MARYLLHLHECGSITQDVEGLDFASFGKAREFAIRSAREIMAAEVAAGSLCLNCHIEIVSDAGETAVLTFRDVVNVEGHLT